MKNLSTFFLLFISFYSFSQLKTPPASPAAEIEQVVGLTEIEVDYNRPSRKGREIFGNLVPYGKLWRTGANSSTKISFSTDVVIKGKTIEEVVIIATVEDPCAVLSKAAIRKGITMPKAS